MKLFSLIVLFYTLLVGSLQAQQTVTEVIPLGYRSVNEIAPLLRPLVSPNGSVSGLQGQLVVTATPQKLSEIRKLLATLDRAPARLIISVKRENSLSDRQDSAAVQGQTGNLSVNNGGLVIGGRAPGPQHGGHQGLSVKLKSNSRNGEAGITQQVQVLEGREAYISAGEEFPVRNRSAIAGPGGIYGYDSVEYYPAVTGFYATPRLQGNEVFLEINTVSRQRGNLHINGRYPRQGWQSQQDVAVSNLGTTVRGRLGEWIAIGGTDQSGSSTQRGILSGSRSQQATKSQIFLRVEEIK